MAFQRAARDAGMSLLEPVMAVEVVTPAEYVGTVIGNLNARRGEVRGFGERGNAQVIDALVPLATMFGYVTDLRGRTQGRGSATMHFAHYAVAPDAYAADLLARA
jgi:elongation factor G